MMMNIFFIKDALQWLAILTCCREAAGVVVGTSGMCPPITVDLGQNQPTGHSTVSTLISESDRGVDHLLHRITIP